MQSTPRVPKSIKPIETRYKGYRFRSRLEARWAVFFDACGVEWEYEPEGFQSGGVSYLPDFRLHGVTGRGGQHNGILYVEVKGESDGGFLKSDDLVKIQTFGMNFDPSVGGLYDGKSLAYGDPQRMTAVFPHFCDECSSQCEAYHKFRSYNHNDSFNGRWFERRYTYNYDYSGYNVLDLYDSEHCRIEPSVVAEIDTHTKVCLSDFSDYKAICQLVIDGQKLDIPIRVSSRRCCCPKYLEAEQNLGWEGIPLLVVDNMFHCTSCSDMQSHFCRWGSGWDDSHFYFFTWIDGDSFPISMGLNERGEFQIETCEETGFLDHDATLWALNQAKQARFEHGETPVPVSWKAHRQALWDRRWEELDARTRKEQKIGE